ncbi:hypothetical protein [Nocardia sp. Marseille-Q1738]
MFVPESLPVLPPDCLDAFVPEWLPAFPPERLDALAPMLALESLPVLAPV